MANAIYNKYKEALISGGVSVAMNGGNLSVSLVDSNVTPFGSTDEFYNELVDSVNGVVATETLANVTLTNGVLDADDITFTAVPDAKPESEALLFWINTGDPTTSRLVAWMDTDIDGFPIDPDGTDITVTWSTSGIFKL